MRLRQWWRSRWARWIHQRIPPQQRVTLNQRSIFILPSREGVLFIIALMAIFIGGVNYENSLILALNFFLTGLMLVVILQTWRNLSDLTLSFRMSEAGFEGEFVMYQVTLASSKPIPHESIQVGFPGLDRQIVFVPANGEVLVKLFVPAARRGLQTPGRLCVETRYPLGIMRAWSWVDLELSGLVFPKPVEGLQPLQPMAVIDDASSRLRSIGHDDFAGLTSYAPGDPLSRVYWKVLARGMPLATKSFEEPLSEACWLSFDVTTGQVEDRLRVLCYWVLKLTQAQTAFGLDLGHQQIAVSTGVDHRTACLTALALFQQESTRQPGKFAHV